MKRILVVEDHHLVRTAVQMLLTQWFDRVTVDTAESLAEADRLLQAQPECNIVVLDLDLPDAKGTVAIATLRAHHPLVPIVVFSAHDHSQISNQCLELGAAAHLSKTCYPKELVDAVREHARADSTPAPLPTSQNISLTAFRPTSTPVSLPMSRPAPTTVAVAKPRLASGSSPVAAHSSDSLYCGAVSAGLTERQAEVLLLLCDGLSNREIAERLKLREPTIKVHLSQIYKCLRVKNRFEALLVAQRFRGAPVQAVRH